MIDTPPPAKLWTPSKPAIIRAADARILDRATFPFPIFCPAAAGIDPNVKMLFHFDGTNGSTTFTDSSSYAKTWSTTGSPSLSTAQFKFGTASLRLNGSSVVSRASDTDLSLTGDFAIDVQCRLDSLSGFPIPIDTGTGGFLVYLGASSVVVSSGGADVIVSASSIISTNTWFHLMVSRVGTSVRLFVDGTQRGSTWTKSGTLSNNQVSLGADVSGGSKCTGYFDEFRFLNGAGVSSNFTAPTAPY